ncbi:MAG: SapC family protein [Gammaproteobacteria bacterium]|nr:SapC family protein [Gammaproteobacteria bacterium]
MTNFVLLNQADHSDIKVITDRAAKYGDNLKSAMTFPFEFRNIQGCYPIFFQKDSDSGSFFPLALFGFTKDENLFLSESGWDATYIPLMIRRQPFLIGFQEDATSPEGKKPVVSIDMDSPRISKEEGEALFMEHGGTTEFLQEATANLELIHQAHEHGKKFMQALLDYELLESITLDVQLDDGSQNQLLGYYTINEDKVQKLGAEALGKLNEQGFLQPIFMVIASHNRIRTLVDLKNASLKQ